MNSLLSLLGRYRYAAMFGVLLLCGLGLPLPEEVTLIASGLAVGWEEANFWIASLVCVAGILAGDSFIFAMGRYYGRRFLNSRPMQWILTEKRLAKINNLFSRHGSKAVFFTRFFAGVRIGVYAYAGQHGMKWTRFLFLDLLGALISGPTSVWVGKFVAQRIADPAEARALATKIVHRGQHWIYLAVGIVVLLMLCHWYWSHRGEKARREKAREAPPGSSSQSGSQHHPSGELHPVPEVELMGLGERTHTSGREARSGGEPRSRAQ